MPKLLDLTYAHTLVIESTHFGCSGSVCRLGVADLELGSVLDKTHRQTHTAGQMGYLGLATVHRTSARH